MAQLRLAFCLPPLAALVVTVGAQAQTAPDSGSLLREQAKPPVLTPAKPATVAPAVPRASDKDAGPKILVKGFRISGAILIAEAELAAQLQAAVGQQLSLTQLEDVAAILTAYYADRGYLARIIVPPQDIRDGIVKLQVIEGKRGSLRIDPKGERIDSARIKRMIDSRLASGDAMNVAQLGEALNILNEQPGVAATSSLVPGKGEAEIDLVVIATQKPLLSTTLGANNQGSRATGELQASAGLSLANPTGNLDAASLTANSSGGSTFERGDYSIAVGDRGLRLGINASHLRYHLTQAIFAALDGRGTASTTGLTVAYPLARRSDFNLSLTGSYDNKRLVDQTVVGETSNRRVNVTNIGMNGYFIATPGSLLGNGITSFGSSLSFGDSDQRNAGALATDATTRQVQGNFSKFAYNAGYLTALSSAYSLNATLRGQFADKNLDSSERFSLGGPGGVRAYPVGEASGAEGWLASLSLTRRFSDALAVNAFADFGGITVNRKLWPTWNAGAPNLRNDYTLSDIGIGLDWRISPELLLATSVASPLGKNPGRDANNLNIDGSPQQRPRGWISLTAQF